MTRLFVHVEGSTEEQFVYDVLAPYLYQRGFTSVAAPFISKVGQPGGISGWDAARIRIMTRMKEDPASVHTTMVDYYGLPRSDNQRGWPGRRASELLPTVEKKAECIEAALFADICTAKGVSRPDLRFLPFVVMHEFEGLLFSDCELFAVAIAQPHLAARFQFDRDEFSSPEEINDSQQTAPSKRIEKHFPRYQKPTDGIKPALAIGLDAIRRECPHFRQWLEKLESWPSQASDAK